MTPPGAWFSFYIIQVMQVKGNNDDIQQLDVVRGCYEPSLLSFLYIYLFLRLHFIVMMWVMLLDECLIAMSLMNISNILEVQFMSYVICMHCFIRIVVW